MISLASEPRTPSAMNTYLPMQFHAGLVVGLVRAVLGDAEHAGDDALAPSRRRDRELRKQAKPG